MILAPDRGHWLLGGSPCYDGQNDNANCNCLQVNLHNVVMLMREQETKESQVSDRTLQHDLQYVIGVKLDAPN